MAAIKSEFASLPTDEEELATAIASVRTELEARGWDVPEGDHTRDSVMAHLQRIAGDLIAAEIAEDAARPDKPEKGNPIPKLYKGQSDAAIAATFNAFRAGRVFTGLPFAPNAITADDVTAARKG